MTDARRPLERQKVIVAEMLKDFSDDEKKFLLWHSQRGKVMHTHHRTFSIPAALGGALTKARHHQLIQDTYENNTYQNASYVNPAFRDGLIELLSEQFDKR